MPLSRLLGYYGLLMLLCSALFARWLPPADLSGDITVAAAQDDHPYHRTRPLRVSLRVAPSVVLPVSK